MSSPKEEISEPNFSQSMDSVGCQTVTAADTVSHPGPNQPAPSAESTANSQTVPQSEEQVQKPDTQPEPSVFDLLSDIDFSVEQKPLMPEIKVPQISESAIKKPIFIPKEEPMQKPVPKEEVIERPAKMDLFSDPVLLNNFTQGVKLLHKLVDSFTSTGSTKETLEAKWKALQDEQVSYISYIIVLKIDDRPTKFLCRYCHVI